MKPSQYPLTPSSFSLIYQPVGSFLSDHLSASNTSDEVLLDAPRDPVY